eukprot:TRINITY_DN2647_c0_g1_i2.p1 TRINITY_DN2647_c0_g1~~TRINITY_DN2647_c0_g1_i2.p1  ORF type:complete len:1234 (+),score=100.53 TRINITY_DN2647_c0_g1_i2:684-4385(+)
MADQCPTKGNKLVPTHGKKSFPKRPVKEEKLSALEEGAVQYDSGQEDEQAHTGIFSMDEGEIGYLDISVNGYSSRALVDTGAHISCISTSLARKAGLVVNQDERSSIRLADGKKIIPAGTAEIELSVGGHLPDSIRVRVMEDFVFDSLLGMDTLKKLGAHIHCDTHVVWLRGTLYQMKSKRPTAAEINDFLAEGVTTVQINPDLKAEEKEEVSNVLTRHKEIFQKIKNFDMPRSVDSPVEHRIELLDDKPVVEPIRRLSPHREKIITNVVDNMLKANIIQKSHSAYAAPVVLVAKADGSLRFCVDYRGLNQVTKKDPYPLPRIQHILDHLGDVKYFALLDCEQGYYQIRVREEDRHKTAFRTPRGLYEFNVMPFGLCNAPGTFQRAMDETLGDFIGNTCFAFIDDLCVWGKTIHELCVNLDQVLTRLVEKGWIIKPSKCKIGFTRLSVLGNIVGNGEIQQDPAKVEAIQSLKPPNNQKTLRSFLGSVGYFWRFIKNFAKIADPLFESTKPNSFNWSAECQQAFIELKAALMKRPILCLPDWTKPFMVRSDASGFAIGAELAQVHEGRRHPLAFMSRKLKPAELNYAPYEREALAAVEAIKHWQTYLEGKKFTLVTDNRAVKAILRMRDPPPRIARWVMWLQKVDFESVYHPGNTLGIPDTISRDPGLAVLLKEGESLPKLQREDREIMELISYVDKAKLPKDKLRSREIVALAPHLQIQDEVLEYVRIPHGKSATRHLQARVVVPTVLRQRVLTEAHDVLTAAHLGLNRTYARLLERYWWPNMWRDTSHHVHNCLVCAKTKKTRDLGTGRMEPMVVGRPWELVGVDFLGPLPKTKNGNRYLLVFVDYFSRWTIAVASEGANAEVVASALLKQVYYKFGAPKKLISDNGTPFTAALTKTLCAALGVEKIFTTPYHPQANGQTERWNATILTGLRAYVDGDPSDWDTKVDAITFAYNTSEHAVMRHSPYFLLFGQEARMPFEAVLDTRLSESTVQQHIQDMISDLDKAWNAAREAQEDFKRRQHQKSNPTQLPPKVREGDKVMLRTPGARKLEDQWEGPFEVIEVIGDSRVAVDRHGVRTVAHLERVKLWRGDQGEPKRIQPAPAAQSVLPPQPAAVVPSGQQAAQTQSSEKRRGGLVTPASRNQLGKPKHPGEVAVDPPTNLKPKELIGRRVSVYWPKFKQFFAGRVVGMRKTSHEIRYDDADPKSKDETYFERLTTKKPSCWYLLEPARRGSK